MHLASAGGLFVITLVLFALGVLGAGDSKLMSAYGLWLGMEGLIPFLFGMAIAGFFLALAALVIRRFHLLPDAYPASWPGQLHDGHAYVPYGVAIFAGALFAYIEVGYFNAFSFMIF
jgi:prepilin peptidase CpaA